MNDPTSPRPIEANHQSNISVFAFIFILNEIPESDDKQITIFLIVNCDEFLEKHRTQKTTINTYYVHDMSCGMSKILGNPNMNE